MRRQAVNAHRLRVEMSNKRIIGFFVSPHVNLLGLKRYHGKRLSLYGGRVAMAARGGGLLQICPHSVPAPRIVRRTSAARRRKQSAMDSRKMVVFNKSVLFPHTLYLLNLFQTSF